MKPKLSIVILNYKSAGLVKQCLAGLDMVKISLPYEIIVVDNNSQDNIAEVVANFPQVKLISLPRNKGFAVGNNVGIRQAQGEFILLLNPDIAVLTDSIERMCDFLENHIRAGVVVPQLLNPDRTIQMSVMRFPSFFIPLYRRTFFGKLRRSQKILDDYLMKSWDHQDIRKIDWALGACLLIRRKALQQVGLLDERYFLYVEDTDWCRRFWEQGWEIYYHPDAKFIHYHMRESAAGFFSKLNLIHIISWIKYFIKFRKRKINFNR